MKSLAAQQRTQKKRDARWDGPTRTLLSALRKAGAELSSLPARTRAESIYDIHAVRALERWKQERTAEQQRRAWLMSEEWLNEFFGDSFSAAGIWILGQHDMLEKRGKEVLKKLMISLWNKKQPSTPERWSDSVGLAVLNWVDHVFDAADFEWITFFVNRVGRLAPGRGGRAAFLAPTLERLAYKKIGKVEAHNRQAVVSEMNELLREWPMWLVNEWAIWRMERPNLCLFDLGEEGKSWTLEQNLAHLVEKEGSAPGRLADVPVGVVAWLEKYGAEVDALNISESVRILLRKQIVSFSWSMFSYLKMVHALALEDASKKILWPDGHDVLYAAVFSDSHQKVCATRLLELWKNGVGDQTFAVQTPQMTQWLMKILLERAFCPSAFAQNESIDAVCQMGWWFRDAPETHMIWMTTTVEHLEPMWSIHDLRHQQIGSMPETARSADRLLDGTGHSFLCTARAMCWMTTECDLRPDDTRWTAPVACIFGDAKTTALWHESAGFLEIKSAQMSAKLLEEKLTSNGKEAQIRRM